MAEKGDIAMSLDSRIANLERVITESIRLYSNLTQNDIRSLQGQINLANAQLLERLNRINSKLQSFIDMLPQAELKISSIEDTLARLENMLTAMQKDREERE